MLHRRPQLVAGLAAIVLGTAAMAAVVAWAPAAAEHPVEVFAPEQAPAARAKCAECGVIVSKREIEDLAAWFSSQKSGLHFQR